MTLACPAAADLRALLEERLAHEYEATLLAHVEECADCQAALERLTTIEVPSAARLAGAGPTHLLPNPTPPPARLGPFRLDRELGRGGMGVVYLAHHTRLRRPAAVKVIRSGAAATPEQVARFRTEAEAVAAVRHPNVIQVFETGEHEHSAWIALEYVPGGTLRERLNGRPLPPREAARLMAGVARGAAAAHERGIVHRDLKPGNVLLAGPDSGDPAGGPVPKVTDFGLAKLGDSSEHLTQTGMAIGTPHYMAPEQTIGQVAGPATDVYAIGAMLYECLTGRPPFDAVEQLALLNQVARQPPVPVRRLQPSVPRDLETVCLKCLEKEPARRYPSAAALADDLDRFLAGRPTAARPVSWAGHAARWCRRNRSLAGLAAALVMAVVAGGALVTWKWRVAEDERKRAEESATNELQAKRAIEEKLRLMTEAQVEQNFLIYEAAFRLKNDAPDAARRALVDGLGREADWMDRAGINDPKLQYRVRSTAGHAYRMLERYPEAIRQTEAALAEAETGYGPDSLCVVAALIELAALHELVGDRVAAADYRRRGLDVFDRMPDPDDAVRTDARNILMYWREWGREPQLAARLAERLLADARRRHPPDHPDVLEWVHELAWAELRSGRLVDALTHEREAALGLEAYFGAGHERCVGLAQNAQALMIFAGRTDSDLFALVRRTSGPDLPNPSLLALRGYELLAREQWAEAEPVLRECLKRREAADADSWLTFNTRAMLGGSLLGLGRVAEAERLLLEGYQGMKAREAKIPPGGRARLTEAANRLARLYRSTGRLDEAARWHIESAPREVGPVPREVAAGPAR
jgi:hypothetical protein